PPGHRYMYQFNRVQCLTDVLDIATRDRSIDFGGESGGPRYRHVEIRRSSTVTEDAMWVALVEKAEVRAVELIAEFEEHCREVRQLDPEATDDRRIFDLWMTQKLAAVHILLFDVVGRLGLIEGRPGSGPV